MTAQQLMRALPVLQKIITLQLPIKKAYQIYSLTKVINEQREFFITEEKKLIERFDVEILEDGNIKFPNVESRKDFEIAHREIMEYPISVETIELKFDDLGDATLTPIDLMTLEGIINFIE
jgi:hypothetical protein